MIPLLGGIVANKQAEFVESIPVNLEPMTVDGKMGQFRSPAGAVAHATGPGVDRGAIAWNGTLYRVMGTKLVSVVGGVVTVLGDVGGAGPVNMDYGFDRLAIRSGNKLFYYNSGGLVEVTDIDLGAVLDVLWVDGFFMTTDGTYIVVTELNDPTSVLPLKYGSAEEDPDMVTGLTKVRGEVYVTGRYTIEVLSNVGGNGFPFVVVDSATIPFGCVSANAKCAFGESFAFTGSARGEALGVYVAGQGTATKLSTRALDRALADLTDTSVIEMEARAYLNERRLFVHLPDETWVFCETASNFFKQPVWYRCRSGYGKPYRLRSAVECNGEWYCGDTESSAVGTLSHDVQSHFGEAVEWFFDTPLIEGDGQPFILQSLGLIALPGRYPHGTDATVFLSWSRDGEAFGQEMAHPVAGKTAKVQWRPRVRFPTYCTLRIRGYDTAMTGITKLVEGIEAL